MKKAALFLMLSTLIGLMAYSFVQAADTGAQSPGTGTSDGGDGTGWTNPGNITADDGTYATIGAVIQSENLQASNFGFSLPTGATIDGIQASFECKDDIPSSLINVVRMMKDGTTPVGTDLESGDYDCPGTDTVKTYGGATELWGTTWTEAEIENSGFGLTLDPKDGLNALSIDYVTITVYYTEAPASIAATGQIRTASVQVRSGNIQIR